MRRPPWIRRSKLSSCGMDSTSSAQPRIPMEWIMFNGKILENHWKSWEIMGNQWNNPGKSWDILGNQWKNPGKSLEIMGNHWKITGIFLKKIIGKSLEHQWNINKNQWTINGQSITNHGNSWKIMIITSWIIHCKAMENNGNVNDSQQATPFLKVRQPESEHGNFNKNV